MPESIPPAGGAAGENRRSFLSGLGMVGGLISGYGALAALAGRYLFPARPPEKQWMFVAPLREIEEGASIAYQAPNGQHVVITRLRNEGTVADFIALSSVCPHLGCQVHWETQNSRFFCPCHNGTFDPQGNATGGPPFVAGQKLSRFPLQIENGLLYIEVPLV
jgi:cytochrome b6-f complex iron-sulfur subunit